MNEHSASRIARESFDKTLETGTETIRGVQEGFASALDNVRDLNIRLIGMARANTNAAFDFAREVAEAKAGSDLVQVWTTHATKQFDMLTKQASELTTLSQRFASTSAEPVIGRAGRGSKIVPFPTELAHGSRAARQLIATTISGWIAHRQMSGNGTKPTLSPC